MIREGGIYQITNGLSGERYIGSAMNLKGRWQDHLSALHRGQHGNQHLQHAFDKYGEGAFGFAVLEYVEDTLQLIPREQHFFDRLKPEYNIAPNAGSNLGRRWSPETKQKLSEAAKGKHPSLETRAKISEALKGRRHSAETRRRMTGRPGPNYGKRFSNETRKRMSEAWTPERRRAKSEAQKGKRLSKETRAKMSAAWTPARRQQARERMSKMLKR